MKKFSEQKNESFGQYRIFMALQRRCMWIYKKKKHFQRCFFQQNHNHNNFKLHFGRGDVWMVVVVWLVHLIIIHFSNFNISLCVFSFLFVLWMCAKRCEIWIFHIFFNNFQNSHYFGPSQCLLLVSSFYLKLFCL